MSKGKKNGAKTFLRFLGLFFLIIFVVIVSFWIGVWANRAGLMDIFFKGTRYENTDCRVSFHTYVCSETTDDFSGTIAVFAGEEY